MAITSEQIKFYKPIYVNDSLTNGGRISTNLITDGSLNNLFRNIQSSERESGIDLYRKCFIKNENPNDLALLNPKIYIANVSSGEDYFQIAAGTDIDNQSSADDIIDWYGSGYLNANFGPTESSFDVLFKQPTGLPSGCSVIVASGVQQSEVEIIGTPTWNGSIATCIISGETGLTFLQNVSRVSAILPLSDIAPVLSNWSEISSAGTYDETNYPVTLYNIGTITESWTLTFTNSTTFGVTGAVTGAIGTGVITSNFVPVNTTGYYFNLNKAGWAGSWVSGDVITFNTVHAAKSIWVKESVPAGAVSQANNLMTVNLIGESA